MPEKEKKNIFISTAIPYVNAAPHLGFAFELVLADILARYHRLQGHEVFFLTGTDDNALKNVQAATKAGVPVQEFVDANALQFEALAGELDVSQNYFIRTSTDPQHKRGAQKLWQSARPEDIYKKTYGGFYCVGCEEFKTEKDLQDGECPEHSGKKVEKIEEENYFFKLSAYQERLKELLASDVLEIAPSSRKNEMLAFIEGGLEDFSISRSVERAQGWGVPVPGDDSQIQYVWFDALSNYINALGYPDDAKNFHTFWQGADKIIHVIGKGINRFHTIYWPAMLMSAELRVPDTVLVHGYITMGGQKMSKSLGNVVNPRDVISEYGTDALRYYLAREITPLEDGDFTEERFKDTYNANLANGLGNLTARVLKMAESYLDGAVAVEEKVLSDFPDYQTYMEEFQVSKAADIVWERIGALDARIQETQPFKLVKENKEAAKEIVRELVQGLYDVAYLLTPILPQTAQVIKDAITKNTPPAVLFPRKP